MRLFSWIIILLCTTLSVHGQAAQDQICVDPAFEKKIEKTISHTVNVISPAQLVNMKNDVFLLDTREREEYDVSHIPNAHYSSFDNFDIAPYLSMPRDTTIVVYCSIGYRSEKIGEQLEAAGFTNVFNLWGSLFEWANQDLPLVDKDGQPTRQVHTYNKAWSKWVNEDKAKRVW